MMDADEDCGYCSTITRCSLCTGSATWPTCSTASASPSLDPPKLKHPLSASSSLSHILGEAKVLKLAAKSYFVFDCEAL